jgi:Ca-activated chloride channel family protein
MGGSLAGSGQDVAPQGFRASTDLVVLTTSVVTGQGRPIPDLQLKDFQVLEDGVPQTVSYFTPERLPISLSILIDSSSSMDTKTAVAKEAATSFVRRLNRGDVAQIIGFSNDVQIRQAFTSDVALLERAIAGIAPGGSTSLYTAIYVALGELRKVRRTQDPAEIRRQAVVLLSDGEDTTSLLGSEDVLDYAKREHVAVYTIGLRAPDGRDSRGFSQYDYVLRTLAQTSGARSFFVSDIRDVPAIYAQIADELASQYTLGYVSTNTARDGKWRQIAVRVNQPNVQARTRTGYFGPGRER